LGKERGGKPRRLLRGKKIKKGGKTGEIHQRGKTAGGAVKRSGKTSIGKGPGDKSRGGGWRHISNAENCYTTKYPGVGGVIENIMAHLPELGTIQKETASNRKLR